jgi:zinc/manganese transport system substrate-binding protein
MLAFAACLAFAIFQAAGQAPPKLQVVVASDITADLAAAVGGLDVEVVRVGGLGGDPHHAEPTPGDAAKVARADLVVVFGLGLDGDLEKMHATSGSKAKVLVLADQLGLPGQSCDHPDHAHGYKDETPKSQGIDPHAWHDPIKVITMTDRLQQALAERRPSDAGAFKERAEALREKLRELDRWTREQLAKIPPDRRTVAIAHDALGHWGARYGVRIISVEMIGHEVDVSPTRIMELVATVRASGAPVIFGDVTHRSRIAAVVARESGTRLIETLRLDGLAPAAEQGGSAYLATMRGNTEVIAKALQP